MFSIKKNIMRNIFLVSLAGLVCLVLACVKHDTLPPYSVSTIFKVSTSMSHAKDTISSSGDTIWVTAQGNIYDTSRTYGISASLKATDTTAALNLISGAYFKSITVSFDTAGLA